MQVWPDLVRLAGFEGMTLSATGLEERSAFCSVTSRVRHLDVGLVRRNEDKKWVRVKAKGELAALLSPSIFLAEVTWPPI